MRREAGLALALGGLCLGLYAGSRIEAGLHPPVTVLHATCPSGFESHVYEWRGKGPVPDIDVKRKMPLPGWVELPNSKPECYFTNDAGGRVNITVHNDYAYPEVER